MLQRFFIRFICFALCAAVGSLLLLLALGELSVPHWLWGSALLLSLVYSGRLMLPRLGSISGLLLKCGFLAVLLRSLPGVLLILAAMALVLSLLPAACLLVGAVSALWELVSAIRMDYAG